MNPSERLIPLPVLHTPRLILRALRWTNVAPSDSVPSDSATSDSATSDGEAYFAFASDPQVVRYLRWGPHASLQDTEAYLAGVVEGYRQRPDGLWGIELAAEGRLVGAIHLMEIDAHHRKADVGVVLTARYWGQGIASEALRRVLDFAFNELELVRVQGLVITENTAACRLMERCGMAREGVLRRYALQKGQWWDFAIYSILADEPG